MSRFWRTCALLLPLLAAGCSLIPEVAHQPVVHNPFPQLAKVAVAPFFNLSTEPTVDGRQFALAYFNELQLVPGYEVVPVGVVEKTMEQYRISLSGAEDARKLAQILGVDVVVIGAITDFSPYYPPRCTMQVEWYASNPGFHPIPPGYALPWGTTEEEYIPAPLVLESEFALARAQLRTQTPTFQPAPVLLPPEAEEVHTPKPLPDPHQKEGALMQHQEPVEEPPRESMLHDDTIVKPGPIFRGGPFLGPGGIGPGGIGPGGVPAAGMTGTIAQKLPADWPDPNGFVPPGPQPYPAMAIPTNEPVMKHTKTYNGQDSEFTSALESYVFFQTDGRAGSWQAYLQRSDDFIRFCCHMHIFEMLSARGGAGETRVVWRWSNDRLQAGLEQLGERGKLRFHDSPSDGFHSEGATAVNQDINVLALVKGAERYVFLYDDSSRAETLRALGRYASNPDLSFSWYDAAVLSQKIRQESRKATSLRRFDLPLPSDADADEAA